MEEEVARFPEDKRQLLIIVGHHLGLEHLLRQGHQTVDILDGLVGLLYPGVANFDFVFDFCSVTYYVHSTNSNLIESNC